MKKLSLHNLLATSALALAFTLPHAAFADAIVDSVTAGDMQISDAKIVYKKDHLDLFLSIKNNGKVDEKFGGADSILNNSNIVEVSKDKDGKEQEAVINDVLPAGKTVDFDKDNKWIRFRDVTEPRETDIIPISLFFRRGPNANLKLALNPSKANKSPTVLVQGAPPPRSPDPVPTPVAAPAAATPPTTSAAASAGSAAPAAQPASTDAPKKSWLDWFKK